MLKDRNLKTKSDKLLLALADAAGGYGIEASFSESDVCRLAFEAWPADFCLPGYPHLLDTKRIGLLIVGTSLLRREGWISKRDGRYRLTVEGLERVERVRRKPDGEIELRAELLERRRARNQARRQARQSRQSAA